MNLILDERIDATLRTLPEDASGLGLITLLQKRLPPELARAAAGLWELRHRAVRRFPTMSLPYLTKKGLAQASSEVVARRRAARVVARAPSARALDATCSVGADSVALALAGVHVTSCDRDLACTQLTRANLAVHGLRARVAVADATRPAVSADLYLCDPDRRDDGRRSLDPRSWSPTLEATLRTAAGFSGACLKLAPALDPSLLEEAEAAALPADLPRRREWLSRAGELVEVALWTGSLADEAPEERVATRLDRAGGESSFAGRPTTVAPLSESAAAEVAWIADPDPALLRSGLLGTFATSLGLAPLAAQIAYLGGAERPQSPFLRNWRVLGSVPLDRKRVRALLAEHDIGPLRVRKRGHSDPPETLERRFRGSGSRWGDLLVARLERGHRAYLVEGPVAEEAPGTQP